MGDTLARFETGKALINGDGVAKDKSEGMKWVVRAANGGNNNAINFLAAQSVEEMD